MPNGLPAFAGTEPATALREQIWRVPAELRSGGLAILAIDKYVDRQVTLARRHTILERGRVAWTGSSAELAAAGASALAQGLLAVAQQRRQEIAQDPARPGLDFHRRRHAG